MRGVSKDVAENLFTFIFALGIVATLYIFATTIFLRGSKITISPFEEGGCACLDAVPNTQINCGGQPVFCTTCEKTLGQCNSVQEIKDFENILTYHVKKIRVCTIAKNGNGVILVNDNLIGSTEAGTEKCVEKEFSEPEKITKVSAYATGTLSNIDRLVVYWEKIETGG